jgi:hypothetical protein
MRLSARSGLLALAVALALAAPTIAAASSGGKIAYVDKRTIRALGADGKKDKRIIKSDSARDASPRPHARSAPRLS